MTVKKEIDVMDKETVMLWLEICGNDDCSAICPYKSRRPDCMYMLMANAISLLKAQDEQIKLLEHHAVDNNGKFNAHETLIGKALDAGHIYR